MKIIYTTTGLSSADIFPHANLGGQVQIWGFAKELARKGHEIVILKAGNDKKEFINDVKILSLAGKHEKIFRGIPSQFLFSKKSIKIIHREKPDILSLQFRFSSYFLSKLNVPKVYVLHEPDALDYFRPYAIRNNILNYPLFYFKKLIESKVMSNSDEIIVLNKYIKSHLQNRGYPNVKMIPNAINPNDFYNKGDHNFILYAGRFDWNKQVDNLIKAYSMLNDNLKKKYKLKIVGTGYEEQYLMNLVRSKKIEKNVEFIPWIERRKLIDLMSKCSIFVLPSLFECMPVTILEAMASKKSAIASNIPGSKDIITHEYDGFLFEKENLIDLKEYLELLLGDQRLRNKIGENAFKTVIKKYTFKKVANEYMDLYNTLVRK